jgi:aarF domain-containing kinase
MALFPGAWNLTRPQIMINAHVASMELLGTPFRDSTPQPYSFARGSDWVRITEDIRAQIPIILNNRLTPPPRETYSLNRSAFDSSILKSWYTYLLTLES